MLSIQVRLHVFKLSSSLLKHTKVLRSAAQRQTCAKWQSQLNNYWAYILDMNMRAMKCICLTIKNWKLYTISVIFYVQSWLCDRIVYLPTPCSVRICSMALIFFWPTELGNFIWTHTRTPQVRCQGYCYECSHLCQLIRMKCTSARQIKMYLFTGVYLTNYLGFSAPLVLMLIPWRATARHQS